jgi:hypothetical protein
VLAVQEADEEIAVAVVEKAKHRFSAKVQKVEDLRVRLMHGRRKVEEKRARDKEERMRKLRLKSTAALCLADSTEFPAGAFAHLSSPSATASLR